MCETGGFSKQLKSGREDTASLETTPNEAHSFEEPKIEVSTTMSEGVSNRPRLDSNINEGGFHLKATNSPQGIRPLDDKEVVVVTERYIYRPRYPSHVQEGHKDSRQDLLDKTTMGSERHYQRFATESEAANYYKNDWFQIGEPEEIVHQRVHQRDLEKLTVRADSYTYGAGSSSHNGGKMPTYRALWNDLTLHNRPK